MPGIGNQFEQEATELTEIVKAVNCQTTIDESTSARRATIITSIDDFPPFTPFRPVQNYLPSEFGCRFQFVHKKAQAATKIVPSVFSFRDSSCFSWLLRLLDCSKLFAMRLKQLFQPRQNAGVIFEFNQRCEFGANQVQIKTI